MTTKAIATLGTARWLCAALVTLALAAMPGIAAAGFVECSPSTCTSPVVGPGHHVETETR